MKHSLVDQIIPYEPKHSLLVTEIYSKILYSEKFQRNLQEQRQANIKSMERYCELTESINDIVWNYIRQRKSVPIGEIDDELYLEPGAELPPTVLKSEYV